MVKVKSTDTLALDKSKQKKVIKQTRKLKKKIQDGKITIKRPRTTANTEQNRGLIYIGHIPHGFYETEMNKYFKQFGAVTNVKVCRSNNTGNSKGFGYVEFAHPEVAKIAAETMNNYLMFKKRIVAEYVPFEKRPKSLFKGKSSTAKKYSSKVRGEKQRVATLKMDEKTYLKRSSARLSRLNKKLQKLKEAGVDYDFIPVDVPERVKEETTLAEEVSNTSEQDSFDSNTKVKVPTKRKSVTHVFQQDPFDSDIEVKVPVKSSVKTPKKTPKRLVSVQTPSKTDIKVKKEQENRLLRTPKGTPEKSVVKQTPKNISKPTPKKTPKQTPKAKIVTRRSMIK